MPLADRGYAVVAIDSSDTLVDVLDSHVGAQSIRTVRDDLLAFRRHVDRPVALIVCMGDTLTHLSDRASVRQLFADVAESLDEGGAFILSFRDYSSALVGSQRFISVRSDADRLLTCFLEYHDDTLTVHDIFQQREGAEWRQQVSAYRKLRLAPEWIIQALEAKGFDVTTEPGLGGMTRLIAKRTL